MPVSSFIGMSILVKSIILCKILY
ncbi:hypothetical protein A5848_001807, partial [Enterococcus faecium]